MRKGIPRIRHMRYRRWDRIDRQKLIPWFLTREATDLAATSTTKVVTPVPASSNFTAAAHGYNTGDGPLRYTAATTYPTGLSNSVEYWVIRDDANTIGLARSRKAAYAGQRVTFTGTGTGTQTVGRSVSQRGLYERMRAGQDPRTIAAAADVDNL